MVDLKINDVLAHPLIARATANNTRGLYCVQIGALKTEILIMLMPSVKMPGWFDFKISHAIKTPLQTRAYRPRGTSSETRAYALRRAINSIVSHYQAAIDKGLRPGEDWLIWQK